MQWLSLKSQSSVYIKTVFDIVKYYIWLCHLFYTIIIYICNIILFEANINMLPKWIHFPFC